MVSGGFGGLHINVTTAGKHLAQFDSAVSYIHTNPISFCENWTCAHRVIVSKAKNHSHSYLAFSSAVTVRHKGHIKKNTSAKVLKKQMILDFYRCPI